MMRLIGASESRTGGEYEWQGWDRLQWRWGQLIIYLQQEHDRREADLQWNGTCGPWWQPPELRSPRSGGRTPRAPDTAGWHLPSLRCHSWRRWWSIPCRSVEEPCRPWPAALASWTSTTGDSLQHHHRYSPWSSHKCPTQASAACRPKNVRSEASPRRSAPLHWHLYLH